MFTETGLLDTALDVTTNVCTPAGTPVGTCTFTWYSPTKFGAKPENETVAGTLPMVTGGAISVVELGALEAAVPVVTVGETEPSPVAKIPINSPGRAGLDG